MSTMFAFLCIFLHVVGAVGAWRFFGSGDPFDGCPYSRADILQCAVRYGDVDGNRALDEWEIERLRTGCLYDYEKVFSFVARVTAASAMVDCDADSDGQITEQDYAQMPDTCVPDCWSAKTIQKHICARMAANECRFQ